MTLRNLMLCGATAVAMAATPAFAEDAAKQPGSPPMGMMHGKDGGPGMKREYEWPKSRQEAIAKHKERLKELESMSDEDWNKRQEMRKQRKEDWKEKREERKEDWKAKHMDKGAMPPAGTIPEPKTDKQ